MYLTNNRRPMVRSHKFVPLRPTVLWLESEGIGTPNKVIVYGTLLFSALHMILVQFYNMDGKCKGFEL